MEDGVDFEVDDVVDFEEEVAGVFHAPGDVGDVEGSCRDEFAGVRAGVDDEGHGVGGAVDRERAGEVDFLIGRGEGEGGFEALDGEDGFGVFGALEDFFVHAAVAGVAAAVAACDIDDGGAGDALSGGVEAEGAAFEFESSVDCVEGGVDAEMDLSLGGVEVEGDGLSCGGEGESE